MGQEELVIIIAEQTKVLYANMESVLNAIKESELYDEKICDWPLGQQIYHNLHSMDQWFVNPAQYEESQAAITSSATRKDLTRIELAEYFHSVITKIENYLENLKVESLGDRPEGCQFSRLALILGQYRHFMYHIGFIHGCLRKQTGGTSPAYFGLG